MSGWELVKLGDKANISRGASPRPIQAYITTSSNGINWIKIGDIKVGAKFINSTNEKIIPEGIRCSREVKKGDFILSNSMSFGRPYILNIGGCIHDGWLVIQDYQSNFDRHYLYYTLCSDLTISQYRVMAAGSSVQNLSKEKVASLILPKPPLSEQQAIAEVLSDMDGYIISLEKIIAKKKAVKQGAIWELLTGRIRLPGFEDDWEIIELGDLLEYEQPTNYIVYSTKYTLSGTPVLTAGKSFVLGYTFEQEGIYSNYPIILFDDFLTTSRYVDFPFKVKSSAVKLLKKKREHDNIKLIFELMQMMEFTVVDHQRHWISQYSKIPLRIPLPEEQSAISAILCDMDFEIEALTAKLNKARSMKQGMMQELLTGRTRLKGI